MQLFHVSITERTCKTPQDETYSHAYTHTKKTRRETQLAILPVVRAYGRYLTYFPNVSEACSQVSPPNPGWN